MKFLLIIAVLTPDGQSSKAAVGLMLDEATCTVAGVGMTRVLEETNPGLQAAWACLPQAEASA
jgi:hypothetical protein